MAQFIFSFLLISSVISTIKCNLSLSLTPGTLRETELAVEGESCILRGLCLALQEYRRDIHKTSYYVAEWMRMSLILLRSTIGVNIDIKTQVSTISWYHILSFFLQFFWVCHLWILCSFPVSRQSFLNIWFLYLSSHLFYKNSVDFYHEFWTIV